MRSRPSLDCRTSHTLTQVTLESSSQFWKWLGLKPSNSKLLRYRGTLSDSSSITAKPLSTKSLSSLRFRYFYSNDCTENLAWRRLQHANISRKNFEVFQFLKFWVRVPKLWESHYHWQQQHLGINFYPALDYIKL